MMTKKDEECFRAAIQLYSSISIESGKTALSIDNRADILKIGYETASKFYDQIEEKYKE